MLTGSVIGCGHGGELSIVALSNSSDYELLAAADPSTDARRRIAERFPDARLFADFGDMLADCRTDVVCVATPAPTHAPIALAVLERGVRGLLLEKPLACDVSVAENLLAKVRDVACPVVVPHGMLVLPATQEIKARIRRGDIGRIISVDIQNAVDLLNAGIHWLVYLLDVFENDTPALVAAEFDGVDHVVSDGVQVESRGVVLIDIGRGIRINLHSGIRTTPTSEFLPGDEQQGALFRITGSNGIIEFSAWAGSYWIQVGDSHGELVKRALPDGFSYHQAFLEQLAQNIASIEVDYASAALSLSALRLIESAYQQHTDSEWALGVPRLQPG